MNQAFKKCLYFSLGLHLFLLLLVSIFSQSASIKKPFIVFGAHSKKLSHTFYKFGRKKASNSTAIPFVSGSKHGASGKHKKQRSGLESNVASKNGARKIRSNGIKAAEQKITASSKNGKSSNKSSLKIDKTKRRGAGNNTKPKRGGKRRAKIQKDLPKTSLPKTSSLQKNLEKKLKPDEPIKQVKSDTDVQNKVEAPEPVEEKTEIKPEPAQDAVKQDITLENDKSEDAKGELEVDDEFDSSLTTSTLVLNFTGQVEPELAVYQKCIQREVGRLWRPPVGVPKNTTCRISFVVDSHGAVKNFEIEKRSNVLIYDLSILRVAHLFKFDKKLWGKSFIVDFCQ